MGKTVLLTGRPRVGKTTIIKDLAVRLPGKVGGFYTEEIREAGERVGFRLVTLDGWEGILSHVNSKSTRRVSKYGVELEALETIGVEAIQRAIADCDYVVIDEIGKMELYSRKFKDVVLEAVNSAVSVLGTVTMAPEPWVELLKRHPNVQVIEVTYANRNHLGQNILDLMSSSPRCRR